MSAPEIFFYDSSHMQESEISTLTAMINDVYFTAEGDLFKPTLIRTSPQELVGLVQNRQLLVLRLDSEVIGCMHLAEHEKSTAKFGMLAVHAKFKGHGYGRLLVAHAEDWARKNNYTKMRLELLAPKTWVHAHKKFLHDWYTKLGYQPTHLESFPAESDLATECDFTVYIKAL